MLTTVRTGNLIELGKIDFQTKQPKFKPDCIVDYNKNMRLVDKADMQISSMECMRKSMKWFKKLFFHLVDIVMLNCYNMYVKKTGKKSSLRKFSRQVVRQLLKTYGNPLSTRGVGDVLVRWIGFKELCIMNVIFPNTNPSMKQTERVKKGVMFAKTQTRNKGGKL